MRGAAHRGKVGKAQMCAGSAEKRGVLCSGDSGGILNCRVNSKAFQSQVFGNSIAICNFL